MLFAEPPVPSSNTIIRSAPPQSCRLLDDPVARQNMDGLLFNLLWSCGRQSELGDQPVPTGEEESFEDVARILQISDIGVNNPAGETGNSTTQSETSITYSPVTGTYCSSFNDSYEFYGSTGGGGFTGFARSINGGVSWQDRGAVGPTSAGDPSLVWRRADGFFYLATLASGGDLAVWRSTDDCGSFTLLSTPTTTGDDKEILAVDNNPASPQYGNLYLVWTDFGFSGIPIRAIRSTNGGVTWSAPVTLNTPGQVQGAWPAVAPNGDVFVAWLRTSGTNISVEVSRSTNGGVSYTAVTSPLVDGVRPLESAATATCGRAALHGNIRYQAFPQIAVDGNGVLHVVYSQDPDTFDSGDVVNVYYRRSTNSGASWSTPLQLNDVATGDQYFPTIQVNGSTLVAGWYDRRNDGANLRQDYYKRTSSDGGLTWGSNIRVTDVNSPINLDPGTNTCYHGDYDQSVVTTTNHVMQWADDRNFVGARNDADVWSEPIVSKSAQFVSQSVPTSMSVGQQYPVSVTIKNIGGLTWSPIGPQCSAYRLAQVGSAAWSPARVELPAPLEPGDSVTLNFNVAAPATAGSYNFQLRMVHECVEFFGAFGPNVVVNVQVPKNAQILAQTVPSMMIAGQPYSASVTVKNTGTLTWSPIGPQCNAYRLAQIGNPAWTPIRVELPSAVLPGQQVTLPINGIAPSTPGTYNFQLRMVHECVEFFGDSSPVVPVVVKAGCVANSTTLCFQNNRFQAGTTWRNLSNGQTGTGNAVPYSNEGGFFWFFSPTNLEVGLKVLDGLASNGKFWVFHGSLTDLEYTVTVTDKLNGVVKTYVKPSGSFCGAGDTGAFNPLVGGRTPKFASSLAVPLEVEPTAHVTPNFACAPSSTTLCLLGDRFQVRVRKAGVLQQGVEVTSQAGSFWFFSSTNPEVVVKVLDGTAFNGKYWVFFGSLTGETYQVEVVDSVTSVTKTYNSPAPLCGQADTSAF